MKERKRRHKQEDVLKYRGVTKAQGTILRHYKNYRESNDLPIRCDNPKCRFFSEPLVWNQRDLPVILDHKNGNREDNEAENLRFLCPNCDSQLPTRGGRNKGRIGNKTKDGYRIYSCSGNWTQLLKATPGILKTNKS